MPGQTLIFRKGEPYGQALVIPRKVIYDIKEMTTAEASLRGSTDEKLSKHCKRFVKNDWHDHLGQNFDDKYKVLSGIFNKSDANGVQEFLDDLAVKMEKKKKIKCKLVIKRKDESIQDNEKKS